MSFLPVVIFFVSIVAGYVCYEFNRRELPAPANVPGALFMFAGCVTGGLWVYQRTLHAFGLELSLPVEVRGMEPVPFYAPLGYLAVMLVWYSAALAIRGWIKGRATRADH